jgi:hypothetical protein
MLPAPSCLPAAGAPGETVLDLLWDQFALFFNNLSVRKDAFPGVWQALKVDRDCSRQLLQVACGYHSTVMAAQEPRWPGPRWFRLWRRTAGCLSALQQLAGFDAGWVSLHRSLCQQWVRLAARLERRLAREPGPELLNSLLECSRNLLSYAGLHTDGLRRQVQLSSSSPQQPLPVHLLEAVAAGARGLMAAMGATASHAALVSAPGAAQGPNIAAVVINNLEGACQDLFWGTESRALVGNSGAGPAPVAAAAAAEACVRLAAVFPDWLAGTVRRGAPALHAELAPKAGQLLLDIVSAAQMVTSVHGNALASNHLPASIELSSAAYNVAVSADKLCHCRTSLSAESAERAVLGQGWAPMCVVAVKNMFLFAQLSCQRAPGPEHRARWVGGWVGAPGSTSRQRFSTSMHAFHCLNSRGLHTVAHVMAGCGFKGTTC